ncbi:hypothetical protein FDECE_4571 [Fusarium decemcellulare]|nr:hypothetical protein FDECE_4571 [Fusarium decemcellulare]
MCFGNKTSPGLCIVCESIFEDNSFDSFEWHQRWVEKHPYREPDYPRQHHPSEQSLREAAAAGCWICTTLEAKWNDRSGRDEDYDQLGKYSLSWVYEINCFRLFFKGYTHFLKPRPIYIGQVRDWTPFHQTAYKSKLQSMTGIEEIITLCSLWLSQCRTTHQCVPSTQEQWYPTRLLDISGNKEIRLVDSREADPKLQGPYATLSHCWGKRQFLVLTTENMPEFLSGISLDRLPLTFRQVIQLVQTFQIRYIWIDCYCIIQGTDELSRQDWNREAGLMGEVYSRSFINIGSARSTSPYDGLYHTREPSGSHSLFMSWKPTREWQSTRFQLRWGVKKPMENALSDLSQAALHKRAWVLQETVLSPRMLSFTDKQVFWHCGETVACEDHPVEDLNNTKQDDPFWAFVDVKKSDKGSPEQKWFQVLQKYCNAELTFFKKDKLYAIEGIGSRFAQLMGWQYHRGLFNGMLPQALLWEPSGTCYRQGNIEERSATSWHWASHELLGASSFSDVIKLYQDQQEGNFCFAPLAYVFMFDDCSQFPQSGDVDTTWPCLMCIGRPVDLALNEDEGKSYSWLTYFYIRGTDDEIQVTCNREGLKEKHRRPDCRYVYLPLIFAIKSKYRYYGHERDKHVDRRWMSSQGLLLRALPNGRFERVGLIDKNFEDQETWNNIIKRTPEMFIIE